MKNSEMVRQFMFCAGQTMDIKFDDLLRRDLTLRLELIREEFLELQDAVNKDDQLKVIDGICDILYVTYGFAATMGLDVDAAFAEVHRSNMTKFDDNGEPIFRDDGKLLKGPNFEEPNLEQFCG